MDLFDEVMQRPLDALVGAEDSRIVDEPLWHQVVTPSFKTGGLNGVERCRVPREELEARIDAALADFRRAGVRFRWTVSPGDTPGLVEALRRRGLKERRITAVYAPASLELPEADAVAAREVGAPDVVRFSQVMAEGWGSEVAPLHAYSLRLLGAADRQRLFLATCDGEPAGTAGAAIVAHSVYLIGAVVLPRFRGRGVYRALLRARLQLARALGRPLVTCQANPDTSAPILARLGFSSLGEFPVFHGGGGQLG